MIEAHSLVLLGHIQNPLVLVVSTDLAAVDNDCMVNGSGTAAGAAAGTVREDGAHSTAAARSVALVVQV